MTGIALKNGPSRTHNLSGYPRRSGGVREEYPAPPLTGNRPGVISLFPILVVVLRGQSLVKALVTAASTLACSLMLLMRVLSSFAGAAQNT